jgi:CRISPR-associated protein Csn2
MILVNPNYFEPITITEDNPETLIIEKNSLFRELFLELLEQANSERGSFILTQENQLLSFKQNVQIEVNLLNADYSDKSIKTKLQQMIVSDFQDDQSVTDIREELYQFCFRICANYSIPIRFKTELTASDLIKAMDFCIDLSFSSWTESILLLMEAQRVLLKTELFIFAGLKDFMDPEEYASFEKEIKYRKLRLLMIEHREHPGADDKKHLTIIDKDLCVLK